MSVLHTYIKHASDEYLQNTVKIPVCNSIVTDHLLALKGLRGAKSENRAQGALVCHLDALGPTLVAPPQTIQKHCVGSVVGLQLKILTADPPG